MKFKKILLTTLAACLLPVLANAQSDDGQRKGSKNHAERFANTDANGDAQLSLDELQGANAVKMVKNFDKIDSNGDGQLTKDELKSAHKQRRSGIKGGAKGGKCGNCESDA